MALFCIKWVVWLQSDFFRKFLPPSNFVPIGPRRGLKILSPPIKNLEKKPWQAVEKKIGMTWKMNLCGFIKLIKIRWCKKLYTHSLAKWWCHTVATSKNVKPTVVNVKFTILRQFNFVNLDLPQNSQKLNCLRNKLALQYIRPHSH